MDIIPSPNIWTNPDVYELENLAIDTEGAIEKAIRSIRDWKGLDVIDIGCGTGFHLPRFATSARSVIGVEPHPPLVQRARARVASLPTVSVIEAGAQQVPLLNSSVDIHHSRWAYFFGPGCEAGLMELERIMRPGGVSFVIDYHATRSAVGKWFRQTWAASDTEAADQFWTDRGWSQLPVDIRWTFQDRASAEAVVRLEFQPGVAEQVLRAWPGTTLDDAVNIWWRAY